MSEVILTESMEDYLEMLYRIVENQGYVRPIDLSTAINVKPSSVTRMLQRLDEAGFIEYTKYRNISLTPKGQRYGKFLVWRDETLKKFLHLVRAKVGVAEQVEGIEHYITPTTMGIIRNLIIFFLRNPQYVEELDTLQKGSLYPDDERFPQLRAWLFRHKEEQV